MSEVENKKPHVAFLRILGEEKPFDTVRLEFDPALEGDFPQRLRDLALELISSGQEVYIYKSHNDPESFPNVFIHMREDVMNEDLSFHEADMIGVAHALGWMAGEAAFVDDDIFESE